MQQQVAAIVYSSQTGFTARYAALLGEATHLPVFDLNNSKLLLAKAPIFYMGWIMAGQIYGVNKAKRQFSLVAACGVGLGRPEENPPEVLRKNSRLGTIPVFSLQGGYAPEKLKGINKLVMSMAVKAMAKRAEQQEGQPTLEVLQNGVDFVKADHLTEILDWIQQG